MLCNLELMSFLVPMCLLLYLRHICTKQEVNELGLAGFTSMANVVLAVTPYRRTASSLLKMSITKYT